MELVKNDSVKLYTKKLISEVMHNYNNQPNLNTNKSEEFYLQKKRNPNNESKILYKIKIDDDHLNEIRNEVKSNKIINSNRRNRHRSRSQSLSSRRASSNDKDNQSKKILLKIN